MITKIKIDEGIFYVLSLKKEKRTQPNIIVEEELSFATLASLLKKIAR
jgi:hypothetical protein